MYNRNEKKQNNKSKKFECDSIVCFDMDKLKIKSLSNYIYSWWDLILHKGDRICLHLYFYFFKERKIEQDEITYAGVCD